jgi:DNA-binding transcriptional regulator of glucitol operon
MVMIINWIESGAFGVSCSRAIITTPSKEVCACIRMVDLSVTQRSEAMIIAGKTRLLALFWPLSLPGDKTKA